MQGARRLVQGVVYLLLALAAVHCAANTTRDDGGDNEADAGSGAQGPSTSATGGNAGGAGGSMAGTGGEAFPCGIDCSQIKAPQCSEARCNMDTKQCEIVSTDGGSCEDGLFCTTNDTCSDGKCIGGPANTCNMTAGECQEIVCDETQKTCIEQAQGEGTQCVPSDLCQLAATCQNGLCIGTTNDCFFQPVPNDCHVSVCNPANGQCEPQPGNEGKGCSDINDLCTVSKTCAGGQCIGGMPKDCSALTIGCFNGVCDTVSGACVQQPIMPGQQCAEATDDCNVGICDMQGMCNGTPTNENGMCNTDACLVGQSCQTGVCQGGTAIVNCISNDQCCPAGCTIANDNDCLTEITFAALNEGHNGNLNGIAGADALCNQQATTAGYMGTWKAFLSSTTQDVKDIVPAALQGLPVKNLLGGEMYANWNAMFGTSVIKWTVVQDLKSFDGKDVDEGTGAMPEWTDADGWHGSNTNGTAATNLTCNDWTSTTAQGKNGEWDFRDLLGQETHTCSYTAAIGCVRVGP